MESPARQKVVQFFFDVSDPYAWATSRWLIEVKKVRSICIAWVPISLAIVNEDRTGVPDKWNERLKLTFPPARVFAAVAVEYPEKVGRLYSIMGAKIHESGKDYNFDTHEIDQIIKDSLAEADLPPELFDVAHLGKDDPGSYEPQLRAFQKHAEELVGNEVGSPIVKLGEHAFFGPVLTRIPTGEFAGELFDSVTTLSSYDHFFELKRSRTERPRFDGQS